MKQGFNFDKANLIHNNKYNYSKVVYKNIDTKVIIVCPKHGDFEQTPYKHINRKQGCPKCKGDRIRSSKVMTIDEFIAKAKEIHGDKYEYLDVLYVNAHTHVNIICPKHGVFRQTPNNHLYIANGCPSCGRNTSKSANDWLASLNIPHLQKEKHLRLGGEVFKVDGFDEKTNTVYEYLGSFWHGNPEKYNREDVNPKNGITFGELYDRTIKRIQTLQNHGYKIIYIWGD